MVLSFGGQKASSSISLDGQRVETSETSLHTEAPNPNLSTVTSRWERPENKSGGGGQGEHCDRRRGETTKSTVCVRWSMCSRVRGLSCNPGRSLFPSEPVFSAEKIWR